MATKQDAAVAAANTLITMAGTLRTLRAQLNDFLTQYNSEGYSTTWSSFATAAQNADGSLGAVDGAPNVAHPINTGAAGLSNLSRAVTETQLVAGVVALQQLKNFFGNVNVVTGNYSQNIDDLAG